MDSIYLAGSCSSEKRTMMMNIAKQLRMNGFTVHCPFELDIEYAWSYSQEEWAQKVFDADLAAIDQCSILIMVTPGRESTAGTNWEQGYAYAHNKQIIVAQYTNEAASLMTYCACNLFIHTDEERIALDILSTMLSYNSSILKSACDVVLT